MWVEPVLPYLNLKMKNMKTYIAFAFLVICMSCSTTVAIETEKNYEAIVLPDGSQVQLNHHSSISFKKNFTPRTIHLDGEAFFTVVPGKYAFIVTTPYGNVEVLGTEFNVKTTSNQLVVDVKKGIVELKTAYHTSKVKKGIKATYKDGEQVVQQIKSNKEYRKWMRSLKKEFKEMGKELQPALKELGDEFEKAGKKLGDEFKK